MSNPQRPPGPPRGPGPRGPGPRGPRGPGGARPPGAGARPPGAGGGPPQQRRRRKAPPQQAPEPQVPQAVDLHVRIGLTDELVRLKPEDWFKVLNHWMLGNEDIVIRVRRSQMETNIVIRGTDSGILTLRTFDPNKNLPPGEVILTEEIREQLLKAQGIE